jgi:hypothetical protein
MTTPSDKTPKDKRITSVQIWDTHMIIHQYNSVKDKRKLGNRHWVPVRVLQQIWKDHKTLIAKAKAEFPDIQGYMEEGVDASEIVKETKRWFSKWIG